MLCPTRIVAASQALLGEPQQARATYVSAIEICSRAGYRPEVALCNLELAELLLAHFPDEHQDAAGRIELAIGEFREIKMQPALERALSHREFLGA